MHTKFLHAIAGVQILLLMGIVLPVYGQTAQVTQRVMPVMELTDVAFIELFLEEQFIIPENPDFTHALFLDTTRDGFGSNDVVILYPSEEQFQLTPYLPEQMANMLRNQGLATDYNLATTRDLKEIITQEAEREMDPKKALASAMLGSLENYYPTGDFEGYVSQQGNDVRVSFWNYTEDVWEFVPLVGQCAEPEVDPVMVFTHKQPEIRTFLDIDGCVIVETSTTGAEVSSRVCN